MPRFIINHREAFKRIGAIDPSRQWSAFDVSREDARKGKAKSFYTTIWNYHSILDENNYRISTGKAAILLDESDRTYWYEFTKPKDSDRRTHKAHWEGLQLALETSIPILGLLKDVKTGKCSLEDLFECGNPHWARNGKTVWLNLVPKKPIEFEVGKIDIRKAGVTIDGTSKACDLGNPNPSKVIVSTTRIVRDTKLGKKLKQLHAYTCQICRGRLSISAGKYYSEAHHIKPVGSSHNGPDIAANILVLCPNCHALCDFGAIELVLGELKTHQAHKVESEYIDYHNSNIFGRDDDDD